MKKNILRIGAFVFLISFANGGALLFAQNEPVTDESQILLETENSGGAAAEGGAAGGAFQAFAVFRAIFVLAVIALAIYGCVYVIKKSRVKSNERDAFLRLLSLLPVNAHNSVGVVSFGRKAWLVAFSDSSASVISEIEDREAVDAMILSYEERSEGGAESGFFNILKRFVNSKTARTTRSDTTGAGAADAANLQKIADKLKSL